MRMMDEQQHKDTLHTKLASLDAVRYYTVLVLLAATIVVHYMLNQSSCPRGTTTSCVPMSIIAYIGTSLMIEIMLYTAAQGEPKNANLVWHMVW